MDRQVVDTFLEVYFPNVYFSDFERRRIAQFLDRVCVAESISGDDLQKLADDYKRNNPKHPMQPVVKDDRGVYRFKENKIISFLLERGSFDLNFVIGSPQFSDEDKEQIFQLIGYSVSGISDTNFLNKEVLDAADAEVERLMALEAPKGLTDLEKTDD